MVRVHQHLVSRFNPEKVWDKLFLSSICDTGECLFGFEGCCKDCVKKSCEHRCEESKLRDCHHLRKREE